MQCVFISLAFITIPLLPLNKPPRESIFCGKVGDWWIKRVLLVLNFLLKNLQRWQVDGWEGKREGKLKGVTSRRANELMSVRIAGLQAGKETYLPQNDKLFAAVLATKEHQKDVACSSFAGCCCPCTAHRTRKRSRTSITGNPAPTNNLTLYLD